VCESESNSPTISNNFAQFGFLSFLNANANRRQNFQLRDIAANEIILSSPAALSIRVFPWGDVFESRPPGG